jgi:uncharacterized protein (DUF1810 family)
MEHARHCTTGRHAAGCGKLRGLPTADLAVRSERRASRPVDKVWMVPMSDHDPFRLARFVEAQAANYGDALRELQEGGKRSHWMWYVFPQMRGLGLSPTALFYGIGSRDEAEAYLAHPVLGPRLIATTEAVLAHPSKSLYAIFGSPDDMKFRSSMTLFAEVAPRPEPFRSALETFCEGEADPRTIDLLAAEGGR